MGRKMPGKKKRKKIRGSSNRICVLFISPEERGEKNDVKARYGMEEGKRRMGRFAQDRSSHIPSAYAIGEKKKTIKRDFIK